MPTEPKQDKQAIPGVTPVTTSSGGAESINNRLSDFLEKRGKSTTSDTEKPKLPIEKSAESSEKPAKDKEVEGKDKDKDKGKTSTDSQKVGSDGMTTEQRERFLEYKNAAESSKARIAELEAKVADHEATKKERDELKALREAEKEESELGRKALAAFNLRKTKAYQEKILIPTKEAVLQLDAIIKNKQLDAEKIYQAIENPDFAAGNAYLSTIIQEMDALNAQTFGSNINNLRKYYMEAARMEADSIEAWRQAEEEDRKKKEQAEKKQREEYDAVKNGVLEKVLKNNEELVNSSLDEGGETIAELFKKEYDGVNFDDIAPDFKAYYIQAGHLLPYYRDKYSKVLKELEKANDTIKDLTKKPGTKSSSGFAVASTNRDTEERERSNPNEKPSDRFKEKFF